MARDQKRVRNRHPDQNLYTDGLLQNHSYGGQRTPAKSPCTHPCMTRPCRRVSGAVRFSGNSFTLWRA
ncbi:hypothetical protein BaRGS_00014939, partial [Batillaria attramentaria]